MVVPFEQAAHSDLIARVLADGLPERTGADDPRQITKPGASGLLAMRLVAGAAPDGYAITLSSESNHILLPLLDSKFPVDVSKEFVPISLSGQFQHTLIVKKDLPVTSVKELVDYLRANPASCPSDHLVSARKPTSPENSWSDHSSRGSCMFRIEFPAALNDLLGGNLDVNFQACLRSGRTWTARA